jgi:hypothetical protein
MGRFLVSQLFAAGACILAALFACVAFPAHAGILVEHGSLPEPGHWRIRTTAYYTPYYLTLINQATGSAPPQYVVALKDCKDPPGPEEANKCFPQVLRPNESRHYAQVAAVAEAGLSPGMALRLGLPLDYVQQYSSDRAKLPPYMKSPVAFGAGAVSFGLERSLYTIPGGQMDMNVSPMGPALGDEIIKSCVADAAGNTKDCVVFLGVPSADLRLYFDQALFSEFLRTIGVLTVNYPFRRTGVEDATTWRGLRFDFGAGLEARPFPGFGFQLTALGQWANPAEQVEAGSLGHTLVSTTGYLRLDLAPAVSIAVAEGVTLRGAVSYPILQSGYQRDFALLAGSAGLILDL